MCVVSMISDDWTERWRKTNPWDQIIPPSFPFPSSTVPVSRPEFDKFQEEVRQELAELKKLLQAAKIYDDNTGQPNCEKDEKVELIRAIGKLVGVDFDDIFGKKAE